MNIVEILSSYDSEISSIKRTDKTIRVKNKKLLKITDSLFNEINMIELLRNSKCLKYASWKLYGDIRYVTFICNDWLMEKLKDFDYEKKLIFCLSELEENHKLKDFFDSKSDGYSCGKVFTLHRPRKYSDANKIHISIAGFLLKEYYSAPRDYLDENIHREMISNSMGKELEICYGYRLPISKL